MFDTIVAGGRVIDGTGSAAFTADVAVKDGRIAAIGGRIAEPAARRIDADGAIVTPGFVDAHSHYDGQVTWDDRIDPSFSNGITTTVLGNCGVGFAPVRPGDQDRMIAVMEGVEDIPGIVLKEGVPFTWESFPEYLDFLDRRRYGVDLGVLVPHAPLRVFAMGDRAVAHEAATPDDIALMAGLVREAMAAGAMGFSSGRIEEHYYDDYRQVPGTYAEPDELEAIARAVGEAGRGLLQLVARGTAGAGHKGFIGREARLAEHRLFERLARVSGRPVHYLLSQFAADPDDWRAMLAETARARGEGTPITAHIASRGFGMLVTLDGYHNFMFRAAYLEIAHLPLAERAAAMREPGRRRAILDGADVPPGEGEGRPSWNLIRYLNTLRLPLGVPFRGEPEYEPGAGDTVGAIAERTGEAPLAVTYDHLVAGDGTGIVSQNLVNYAGDDLGHVEAMLRDPNTVSSLGDGGAHVKLISDASMMPFHLTFWARDRRKGPTFPLEAMVERITGRNAHAMGFEDRGVLAVGRRADINVIDYDRLALDPPTVEHDLPTGGRRLNQSSSGFVATILNGVVTREQDADTGERPGRLVRAGRAA